MDKYRRNLLLDKKIITSCELDKKINITNSNQNIVIDCNLINIFNKNVDKDINKIKFKNIYLIEGNKLVENVFNSIKKNINNTETFSVINYDKKCNYFLNELLYLIIAYQIKDKKELYSYIYDKVCIELDRRFLNFNICDFKKNFCCSKRCLLKKFNKDILIYGCCYTKGKVCQNLENGKCKINSISCKLFTCRYLKKIGIKFKPKDFLLIKKYFNMKQIAIINDSLFMDKDVVINLLLKFSNKKTVI